MVRLHIDRMDPFKHELYLKTSIGRAPNDKIIRHIEAQYWIFIGSFRQTESHDKISFLLKWCAFGLDWYLHWVKHFEAGVLSFIGFI